VENPAGEIVVDNLRRFREHRRIAYFTMLSRKGAEVLKTKVVEEQTTGLTEDLLSMKMKAHRGRGKPSNSSEKSINVKIEPQQPIPIASKFAKKYECAKHYWMD
jgi:hypothetical protein